MHPHPSRSRKNHRCHHSPINLDDLNSARMSSRSSIFRFVHSLPYSSPQSIRKQESRTTPQCHHIKRAGNPPRHSTCIWPLFPILRASICWLQTGAFVVKISNWSMSHFSDDHRYVRPVQIATQSGGNL